VFRLHSKIVKSSTFEIVLASASPRRRELLGHLLSRFSIVPSAVDETGFVAGSPADTALVLARAKGADVAARVQRGLVLAADTVIGFEGTVLGKPIDPADAVRMLVRLRGRRHQVITGLFLVDATDPDRSAAAVVASEVEMANVEEEAIRDYVETGEPLDKAGSYAIQGLGRDLVSGFTGCYSNIVGLPLCEVERLLDRLAPTLGLSGNTCRLPSGEPCPRYVGLTQSWATPSLERAQEND
jgi:septum formation protein